jgi:hypothetical protein
MSARIPGNRMVWPLLAVALSLAVAACFPTDTGQPQPRPQQQPQARAGERGTQPTPPGAQAGTRTETREQAAARAANERTPPGDMVEVRRAWVQVRNAPAADARAIALAFGNDRFPVVERQGDWVRVKLAGNREGWIPFETTQEP